MFSYKNWNAILGYINKILFPILEVIVPLYSMLFIPYFSSCFQFWALHIKKDSKKIWHVQKRTMIKRLEIKSEEDSAAAKYVLPLKGWPRSSVWHLQMRALRQCWSPADPILPLVTWFLSYSFALDNCCHQESFPTEAALVKKPMHWPELWTTCSQDSWPSKVL